MTKIPILSLYFLVISISNIYSQEAMNNIFTDDIWGVYSWASYNSNNVTYQKTPNIKGAPLIMNWKDIEPQKGQFKFDKVINSKLEELDNNDFNTFLMIWVAPAANYDNGSIIWQNSPYWLFENGVPLVEFPITLNPLGEETQRYFPYYLDEDYKHYFFRMIDSLGNYICNLPPNLKKRILFLQSAEGSTGDGGPYKGDPIDPQYDITNEEWGQFRIETWSRYKKAFTRDGELQLPILTNADANAPAQKQWILDSLPKAIGVKNGMFSHGYHISDAQERIADHHAFKKQIEANDKVFFARGEQDAEWKTYGWSTKNTKQAFYWSALYATHCGLSMWNVPWEVCQDETYSDAINLFNKYAAEFNPEDAIGAFCAFRRGLDVSDVSVFPVSTYGSADKSNTQRYINIANAFSDYGANQGDPDKAAGGGMINRKREDYNDAGWQIVMENYQRHITQIDPEQTSVAWWQVDTTIYGRFARGFEPASNKDSMFFDLDDNFYGTQFLNGQQQIKVQITYRDGDQGSWKLLYDAIDDTLKTALEITNSGEGNGWKTASVILYDAYLGNRASRGADFVLVNTGETNCRFHMMAIERNGKPGAVSLSIDSCPASNLYPGDIYQLSYTLLPEGADTSGVEWLLSDENVATINEKGLLSINNGGSLDISIVDHKSGLSDQCFIYILADPLSAQYPYGGVNATIPGIIECEHYDEGGEGVAFHDDETKQNNPFRSPDNVDIVSKSTASNGFAVNWTAPDEWLEYTVDATEGYYTLVFYYFNSKTNPGDIQVSLNGRVLTTITNMLPNEDNTFQDSVIIPKIFIQDGANNVLRLTVLNNTSANLDAIRFITDTTEYVTGVMINNCPDNKLQPHKTFQMSATIEPVDADDQTLVWSSSNPSVATVDQSGLVTTIAGGEALIYTETEDGAFIDSCMINILPVEVSSVRIENCPLSMIYVDETHSLSVVVLPENAENKTVLWKSSNNKLAVVDSTGLVTAIDTGIVIITLVTEDNQLSDQCQIVIDLFDTISSINYPELVDEFLVYPNPVKNKLFIRFPDFNKEYFMHLYNSSGQLLISKKARTQKMELELNNMQTNEFYILEVSDGVRKTRTKILTE